jgi:predicted methyltransferase
MKNIGVLALGILLSMSLMADDFLDKAVKHEARSEQNKQRDQYRHPKETLAFLGLKPDMTVVEIWPGKGWYTEILAPALYEKGKFIAAHFNPNAKSEYYKKGIAKFEAFLKGHSIFNKTEMSFFDLEQNWNLKPNSVDMVLTFRNVHNWYMRDEDKSVEAAFKQFYETLKPGGILGVVEHRMPLPMDQWKNKRSGYLHEKYVITMAKRAGFAFVESSPINDNPKDTADHEKGVWTLPPTLALKDKDREKYLNIGESDRMTLKFVKPAKM